MYVYLGLSNNDIAQTMNISEKKIASTIFRIFKKTKVNRRAKLIILIFDLGEK